LPLSKLRGQKEERTQEIGQVEGLEENHQEVLEKNRMLENRVRDIGDDIGESEAKLTALEKEKNRVYLL
jgi:hypothetical protein